MEETKKMLRSILVSSPLTISVIKLNNDYKELVGVNIPFKELGYDCLLTFLHAIPDVLRVEGNTLQSPVNLIVSKKTEHVNAMVLKQKISKKSGGGFYGPSKKKAALPPRLARSRNMK
ncbi:hypothetical protein HHI36_002265 [Cryptolaemus montrouzieri]|uniref:HTH OST-type domain-containing protein n=1 Tax=Cryptolaemus montrouzieri TaxID=559131 RepID=A0ABD2PA50_9CUCU